MISIGPYRFTEHDARRTLENLEPLWPQFSLARDGAQQPLAQLGTVVCDVIAFALPCRSNARWLLGGDFMSMHHDRGPVSRVYAAVMQPGRIATGAAAILEP